MTDQKEKWIKLVKEKSAHYLNAGDNGFDQLMKGWYKDCNYEEQWVLYGFKTMQWQKNEKGEVHGGVIAGLFDTAIGTVANFTAGENESTTVDLSVSYIRPLPLDTEIEIKSYIVKAGRRAIRMRGEMYEVSTGKLIATSVGTFMPL